MIRTLFTVIAYLNRTSVVRNKFKMSRSRLISRTHWDNSVNINGSSSSCNKLLLGHNVCTQEIYLPIQGSSTTIEELFSKRLFYNCPSVNRYLDKCIVLAFWSVYLANSSQITWFPVLVFRIFCPQKISKVGCLQTGKWESSSPKANQSWPLYISFEVVNSAGDEAFAIELPISVNKPVASC